MGYYIGNGETTGGGSSVSLYESFIWYGAHNVYQRTTSTTTRKSGVSLETAKNESGDINMQTYQFTWSGNWHWSPNCKGTKKQVSYSQIGGSNLYELSITNETIQAKLDGGGWIS